MVRVVNNTNNLTGELRLSSAASRRGEHRFAKTCRSARDYFVDLPQLGEWVKAELAVPGDDFVADNAAWLVREGVVPRLEPRRCRPSCVG